MNRQRCGTRRRGTAAVEMALVLPLLLTLIMCGVDLGFQLYVVHQMTSGAREAARVLAVQGGTTTKATAAAMSYVSGFHATFSVTFPSDPCDAIVCVSVPQQQVSLGTLTLLGKGKSGNTLRVQATMRKEQ
jgi:Flp pilus assembly protein TadG